MALRNLAVRDLLGYTTSARASAAGGLGVLLPDPPPARRTGRKQR